MSVDGREKSSFKVAKRREKGGKRERTPVSTEITYYGIRQSKCQCSAQYGIFGILIDLL
jgi:hypothetical protein